MYLSGFRASVERLHDLPFQRSSAPTAKIYSSIYQSGPAALDAFETLSGSGGFGSLPPSYYPAEYHSAVYRGVVTVDGCSPPAGGVSTIDFSSAAHSFPSPPAMNNNVETTPPSSTRSHVPKRRRKTIADDGAHSRPALDTPVDPSPIIITALGGGGGGGGGGGSGTGGGSSPSPFRNVSACNRCRLRKNRCDQRLPACQSCEKAVCFLDFFSSSRAT